MKGPMGGYENGSLAVPSCSDNDISRGVAVLVLAYELSLCSLSDMSSFFI